MVTLLTSCLLDWKSAGTPHTRFLPRSPGQEVRWQEGGAWRKTSDATSIFASELFDLQQQQSFSPNFAKFSTQLCVKQPLPGRDVCVAEANAAFMCQLQNIPACTAGSRAHGV